MRIGDLSKATGVSIATIRLYEREGLIDPASRTDGRFREFTPEQEQRLYFIKRIRNLGFSLDDVKTLLALSNLGEKSTRDFVERILSGIANRKHDLDRLSESLRDASEGMIAPADIVSAFRGQ
ncbi:MerR family transcriptional regulator [Pacificimonas sp. ICDLI1SI03]